MYCMLRNVCMYLSLWATRSATFWMRLGTKTKGISRISSPPASPWNVKGAFSARRFSPIIFGQLPLLLLLSLEISIWNSFSQLYVVYCCLYSVHETQPYLHTPLICFQVNLLVVFKANPWSGGITSGSDACFSSSFLFSFDIDCTSASICSTELPPLTTSVTASSWSVVRWRVFNLPLSSELWLLSLASNWHILCTCVEVFYIPTFPFAWTVITGPDPFLLINRSITRPAAWASTEVTGESIGASRISWMVCVEGELWQSTAECAWYKLGE